MFALFPLISFYSSLNSSGSGAAVWVGDALSWQLSKVSCARVQAASASVLSPCKKYLSVCIYKNKSKGCYQGEVFLMLKAAVAKKKKILALLIKFTGFSLNLFVICLTVIIRK